MTPPSRVTISPASRIAGTLRLPGDKSISHRYAMLAALSDGLSVLEHYSPGADCHSTLGCLRQLGVEITVSADTVTLMGRGVGGLRSPEGPLDAGNSGTTMRLMAGILAAHPFTSTMIGDESLSRRPMRRVMAPLVGMGAQFDSTDGHAPLIVRGRPLTGTTFAPEVPSAQVKSAVLLAGLHASGSTTVRESAPTRDHTERALAAFGASIDAAPGTASLAGGQRLTAKRLVIPGDFSSAVFWLIAAASSPGSRLTITDVGLNPTRTSLLDVLTRYGARVDTRIEAEDGFEPRGTITVEGGAGGSVSIAPEEVPGLIDEIPALAALAASGGDVVVRGASELRVKESDRIAALVSGFRALGFDAEEFSDGFAVRGTGGHRGGTVDACGDHRIAMAFAIAALSGRGPTTIDGAEAVAISYPGFFTTLEQLRS